MTTRTDATFFPPIPEAQRWLKGVTFPEDRPLLNLAQAAPADPPPAPMLAAMSDMLGEADSHLYGPVLGRPDLRVALAADWSAHYGATLGPENVAITAGCNQAFAATLSALTGEGDEVLLPVPWYFNHKMWLDMSGVRTVPLPCTDALIPDVDAARARITPRTRAIVLVSPNNPTGVEYPADTLRALHDLCRETGVKLIIDETYRDFDSRTGAPHDLLRLPDWDKTLIQLYSFSKAYRLTGHRVGAIIAAPDLLHQIEKFQDTVAICAPSLGQKAALWGLTHLGDWKADQRQEILQRRAALAEAFAPLEHKGWRMRGLGAYFAYLEHPFAMGAADLAPLMVQKVQALILPATMFTPAGDASGDRCLRVAFANADAARLRTFVSRLEQLDLPPLAPPATPA
ncbi:aspartate/methionine/tyrosine aminotransferase [Sagittula marina]|uniref:aspartate transaminase n=1 Tax=Sagittula marina TaxID=943940 RepID=A0A7W6GUA8_9RHOB|nr:aminotransferase [Sagittula marina]MBB3987647.1 aspartate/methionine/tyrosine aminotransferase [Sagittula marina]